MSENKQIIIVYRVLQYFSAAVLGFTAFIIPFSAAYDHYPSSESFYIKSQGSGYYTVSFEFHEGR